MQHPGHGRRERKRGWEIAVVDAVVLGQDEHVEAVLFAPRRLVECGAVQVRVRCVADSGGAQVVPSDEEGHGSSLAGNLTVRQLRCR